MLLKIETRHIFLRKLLRAKRTEIIHAFETQHAGYLVGRALSGFKENRPQLYLSNYGSDIFWFQRFASHRKKLLHLLPMVDKYICECSRDISLARKFGLETDSILVTPNSGGIRAFPNGIPQSRDLIAIKGYQSWSGQALRGLFALWTLRKEIRAYRLVVFSCNLPTIVAANLLSFLGQPGIRTYAKGSLTHDEMLGIFSQSAVYLGVSRTDGISTSAIEAMAMGAIPVQSSTSCASEWFEEGTSGFSLPDNRVSSIRKAILLALSASDNETVRARNVHLIQSRYHESVLKEKLVGLYV